MKKLNTYLYDHLKNLPHDLFNLILSYSKNNNIRTAFVGGFIRDLLIQKIHNMSNYKSIDLDILIEGSPILLAKFIKKSIRNVELCLIKEFDIYKTVELNIDGIKIDIASAREEVYSAPGENPLIKDSTIEKDLKRRDFTINSIAFEPLGKQIIDLYEGITHINSKELHLLHSNSVIDDPSRILRCAKYASRLGFDISKTALYQSQRAINMWPWKYEKNDTGIKFPPAISIRLRMELAGIIINDDLSKIISLLYKWEAIALINKNIKADCKYLRGLHWIKKIDGNLILYLLKDSENLEYSFQRFYISSNEKKILKSYIQFKEILKSNIQKFENLSPSEWTNFIEENNIHKDAIKLLISDGGDFWRPLFKWLFIYKFVKSNKNGVELKEQGWMEGKDIGDELKRLRFIQIDNLNTH